MFNIDRFKECCAKKGIKLSYIETRLNLWHGYFSHAAKGRVAIPDNILAIIAEWLDTTIAYLTNQTDNPRKEDGQLEVKIKVFGDVAGGLPMEMIDNFDPDDVRCWEDVDRKLVRKGDTYFFLRIKGDSMEPKIPDGSTVLVRQQEDIESGQIAVVAIGDSATCKKIVKSETGVILMPFNLNHPPQFYSNEQIENLPVRILGRVVKAINNFE